MLPEPRRARPATAPPRSSARAEEQAAAEDVAAKQTAARAEAQKQADKAMDSITKTLSEASGRRTEVKELQEEVAEKDKVTRERQDVIKNELSTTQPILDAAKRAVGGIKSEHLNEIVGYDKKLVTRPQ